MGRSPFHYPLLFSFLSPFLFLLFSCQSTSEDKERKPTSLKYATLLSIEEADSFTYVTIADAWHSNHTLATYILVPSDHPIPHTLPKGIIVRTPIKRAVITTSVHAALFAELDATKNIVGLTDTTYIVSPTIKALLQKEVKSMGTSLQPDLELLRASKTDAVFVSPFENAGHGSLNRLNIPLIECADYMEKSPLGRAEWMRFYGLLIGKSEKADSLFAEIEKAYNSLKEKTKRQKTKNPTVMCDLLTGGTWYQPGGHSTMGRIIADAGGNYLWANRKESGSLALSLETVFSKANQADIWLIKYGQNSPLTYSQMALDCKQYKKFKPWKTHQVYACNTLLSPFYEQTPFHPERLLHNLIYIFHPNTIPAPQYFFYLPLSN